MNPRAIKVLLVDDSLVIRHLVTAQLAKDAAVEVLSAASSGRAALARIPLEQPDVVVLDIEMPELDGLQTLREIRAGFGELPVIMFSTLTDHGAAATLEALACGANEYVAKPGGANSNAGQIAPVCAELLEKIKALCPPRRSSAARAAIPLRAAEMAIGAEVVVIGASTGGPNALAEMVQGLPANLNAPILIAQHMPPIFTRLLAERLSKGGRLPAVEARSGEELTAGKIWIAPGDYHMVLARRGAAIVVETNQAPRENSCRPSVDVLFRSAAAIYGASALGVIMTGMGQDGLEGSRALRMKGGRVIVQDEASSVIWGMPGAVAQAGLAGAIVPLSALAGEIAWRVGATEAKPQMLAAARGGR